MSDPTARFWLQYFWALRVTFSRKVVWTVLLLALAFHGILIAASISQTKHNTQQRAVALEWCLDWSRYGTYLKLQNVNNNFRLRPTDQYVYAYGDLSADDFWNPLIQLKDLKGLSLTETAPLKADAVRFDEQILSHLRELRGLKRLALKGFLLNRECLRKISQLQSLRFLDVETCEITDGLDELKSLPHLQELVVGNQVFSKQPSLFGELRSLKTLRVLGLGDFWLLVLNAKYSKRSLDLTPLQELPNLAAVYANWKQPGRYPSRNTPDDAAVDAANLQFSTLLPKVHRLPVQTDQTYSLLAFGYWVWFLFLCLFGGMHFLGQFQSLGRMMMPRFLGAHLSASLTLVIALSLEFLIIGVSFGPWPTLLNFILWAAILLVGGLSWGRGQVPTSKKKSSVQFIFNLAWFSFFFSIFFLSTPLWNFLARSEPWYADVINDFLLQSLTTGVLWKSSLCIAVGVVSVSVGMKRLLGLYRNLLELGVSTPEVTMKQDWGSLAQLRTTSEGAATHPFYLGKFTALERETTKGFHNQVFTRRVALLRSVSPYGTIWNILLPGIVGVSVFTSSYAAFSQSVELFTLNLLTIILVQMHVQWFILTFFFWHHRMAGLGPELLVRPISRNDLRKDMLAVYLKGVAPYFLMTILMGQIAASFGRAPYSRVAWSLTALWVAIGYCSIFYGLVYFALTIRRLWQQVIVMLTGIFSTTFFLIFACIYRSPESVFPVFAIDPFWPLLAGTIFLCLGTTAFLGAYRRWWFLEFP